MYRYLVPLFILLVFVSSAFAQPIDWKTIDCPTVAYHQQAFDLTRIVNNVTVVSIFNGETVDLTVFRQGPPFQLSGKVEGEKIREIQCGSRSDATMVVTIQQQAIEQIYNSKDQIQTFLDLKRQGAITIETKSFSSQLKVGIAEIALTLYHLTGIKLLQTL